MRSVEPDLEDETWCTTVPTMGAFVANGIVVSNSLGYGCAYASRGKKGISKRRVKDEWDEDAPRKKTGTGGGWGYGR